MNSNFLTSKIIHTDFQQQQLEEICSWLQMNQEVNINIKTILNKSNIILINTENESIKIKTVRELKEKLAYAGYDTKQTQYVIFLSADKLTHAAQNALLKTIEEPPVQTQIILITNTPTKLLPTIRSRCQIISVARIESKSDTSVSPELNQAIKILLSDDIASKIEFAQNYKDRDSAIAFCNKLLPEVHKQLQNSQVTQKKSKLRSLAQQLISITQQLEQNTNVRLTLEVAFLSI